MRMEDVRQLLASADVIFDCRDCPARPPMVSPRAAFGAPQTGFQLLRDVLVPEVILRRILIEPATIQRPQRSGRVIDADQAAKNAAAVALMDAWMREVAEQGPDAEEERRLAETKSALDADRLSRRKLFP